MTGPLGVTPEELTRASARVQASADALEVRVQALLARVDGLLAGGVVRAGRGRVRS